MKVVIFGGTGFLGVWLIKKLYQKGIEFIIFDKKIINYQKIQKLTNIPKNKINFIKGDITIFKDVYKASKLGQVLVNFAGLMTPECSKILLLEIMLM